MSDNESVSQPVQKGVPLVQNFSAALLPPILDIAPPPPVFLGQKDVVTYSKEIQTTTWVPDDESEDVDEHVLQRRIEEEVRKEIERLRLEEQAPEEETEQPAAEELPGSC